MSSAASALAINAGVDTVNLTELSGFGVGTYHLITTAGAVPANITSTTFNVNGSTAFLYSIVDNVANQSIDLTVAVNPNPSLKWVGAPTPGNGTWDIGKHRGLDSRQWLGDLPGRGTSDI